MTRHSWLRASVAFWLSLALHSYVVLWSEKRTARLHMKELEGEVTLPVDLAQAPEFHKLHPAAEEPHAQGRQYPQKALVSSKLRSPVQESKIAEQSDEGLDLEQLHSDPVHVFLFVRLSPLRNHALGARFGTMLRSLPVWRAWREAEMIDPVRDFDWFFVSGPSLFHTERNALVIQHTLASHVVDQVLAPLPQEEVSDEAGVHRRSTLYVAGATRVVLRPQPQLLVIVPPEASATFEQAYRTGGVRLPLRPEAMLQVNLHAPHEMFPLIPERISSLQFWVVPRENGGALLYGAGECAEPQYAQEAAEELRTLVQIENTLPIQLITHNLLDTLTIRTERQTVRIEGRATQEQMDALLTLFGW